LTWTVREWDGPLQYTDPSGTLMMLPTDLALIQDEKFLPYVKAYAADEALFFRDFSEAFSALLAKGCPDHVVPPPAATTTDAATTPAAEEKPQPKDPASLFRDLAMHGSLERMQELYASNQTLNVNAVEAHSQRTALHKASYFGHAHVVEYLCGNNFGNGLLQVNAVDGDGDTALHDAARFGHVQVVKALLDMGYADPTIRNLDGRTALDVAMTNDKTAVVELLVSKSSTAAIEL
jgi:ankyrin repeat protein